ncbi:MAG: VCBS repeat-containing protein, partial [Chitinophagaceae bacterium]
MYRNDGDSLHQGHPVFTDVSIIAGIKEDGYGLGIVVSDFNGDNYPDIYVANDFISNDILWLNNQDGSFTNCISQSLNHQSYSSMGVDAADINNDALSDIVTLDMLPELNSRRKTSVSFINNERYLAEREMGYEPSFVRNMLQLNMGYRLTEGKHIPYFSEIGQLSGIDATDWSWSVLLADFNCDGWKDMHITNGIGRDFIHGDFLEFSSDIFRSALSREEQEQKIRQKISMQKPVELPNYLFLNNKGLIFSDQSAAGGINKKAISNGAASVDLDNDGDLDLVVNNINSEAFVFLNNTFDQRKESKSHSLRIQLKNKVGQNQHAFGAKLFLYTGELIQMLEQNPVRGYFSSIDQRLIFGLGENIYADSLRIIWPDGRTEMMRHIKADTLLTVFSEQATFDPEPKISTPSFLFKDITGEAGLSYKHTEVPFNDFAYQRLLSQKYSQQGPYITSGDINGNGQTDFFIGGGARFSGQIFRQLSSGSFEKSNLTDSLKLPEDADCLFFDADIDGDQDLLVTYGDIQFAGLKGFHSPKLFLNDGKGLFTFKADAIPDTVATIAGTVSTGDFDGDGDPDVFLGGRVSPKYPQAARSFILENNKGKFRDIT